MTLLSPAPTSMNMLLEQLLGESVHVGCSEGAAAPDELAQPYGTLLRDDDGRVVGAIIADLTAAVSLGGQMMLLPQEPLERQIEGGDPTDLVIDAVSDVFRSVTRTMNTINGNPHVEAGPVRALSVWEDEGELDWLSEAESCTGYDGDFLCGAGYLQVVSR